MQVFALLKQKAKTDAHVSKQEKINKGALAIGQNQEKSHSESSESSPGRAPSSESEINLKNGPKFDIAR